MKFEIKCSTFIRLASVCNFFESDTSVEVRKKFTTVRLEKVKGRTIAIATNRRIMVIELLPHFDPSPDAICHVVLDPALIQQCKGESFIDSTLTINTVPEIAVANATTSSGWVFGGNACHWFDENEFDRWREIVPTLNVDSSKYVMAWNLPHVQSLFEASPTGKIYFPQFIDATKPIVVRDVHNDSWVGVFIPAIDDKKRVVEAILPEWLSV